jgi:hypothetical protein
MVNIEMDLTGMECGVVCSCESGYGTSGSIAGERLLDTQRDCLFLIELVTSSITASE